MKVSYEQECGAVVSIIVPIYNREKEIRNCIYNIVEQSYRALQIILVNDGSTDSSGAICDEIAKEDDRIIVLHKANGGVSSARNAGLNACTGKYVLFVDSDDYLHKEAISKLVCAAERECADFVLFGFSYVNVDTGEQRENSPGITECYDTEEFIQKVCAELINKEFFNPPWNKLILAKCIQDNKLRFNEAISICEDMAFSLQLLACARRIGVQEDILYDYNIKETGSLVYKYNANFLEALSYYRDCAAECYEKYTCPDEMRDSIERISVNRLYVHFMKMLGKVDLPNKKVYEELMTAYQKYELRELVKMSRTLRKVYFFFIEKRMFAISRLWSRIKGY